MPDLLIQEPEEIKEFSITEKLRYYKEHNLPQGVAQIFIDLYKEQFKSEEHDNSKIKQAEEYLNTLSVKDKANNNEFLAENKDFLVGVWKHFWNYRAEFALEYDQKLRYWEDKIRKGEIPNAYMIADEPKRVTQLAHALVAAQYGTDIDCLPFIAISLRQCFGFHSANLDDQEMEEALNTMQDKFLADSAKEKGIAVEKMYELIQLTSEHDPNDAKTGLRPKQNFKEGEDIFEWVDPLITQIQGKTPDQLYDRAQELTKKIEESRRFVKDIKQSVKNAKKMLAKLEAARKPGEPQLDDEGNPIDTNSDSYRQLHEALENYCKIGTKEFKVTLPDGSVVNSDHYDKFVLKDATDKLMEAAANYEREHSGAAHLFQSNWGYGKDRLDISRQAIQLCKFNEEYIKKNSAKNEITSEFEKELKLIHAEQKHRGLSIIPINNVKSGFANEIDKTAEKLRISVGKNAVSSDAYADLFDLTDNSQRLCRRLENATLRNDIKTARKVAMELEEHSRKVIQKLDSCKDYENANKPSATDTSDGKTARKEMIESLKTTMHNIRDYTVNLGKVLKPEVEKLIRIESAQAIIGFSNQQTEAERTRLSKMDAERVISSEGKKELHKGLAVIVTNHLLKTGNANALAVKISKTEEGYNALVNDLTTSGSFIKAAGSIRNKKDLDVFLQDKAGAAKLADKFLVNLSREKSLKDRNGATEEGPAKTVGKNTIMLK